MAVDAGLFVGLAEGEADQARNVSSKFRSVRVQPQTAPTQSSPPKLRQAVGTCLAPFQLLSSVSGSSWCLHLGRGGKTCLTPNGKRKVKGFRVNLRIFSFGAIGSIALAPNRL